MIFAGLPFASLVTIAAIAGGLTVLFYILKLRRRPVAVPFSRIWERILRDKEATTWWSRLKRLLSLLLQLALLLLLILALGDPRIAGSLLKGRNMVVLVDASASMKATDVQPRRIDVAKEEVKKLVRGLGGSDRMLIAQMDAALTPLSTMTGESADLQLAADQIRATDTRADFKRGLRFALDSLRGLSKPEIVVVSDGALGDPKEIARGLDLEGVDLRYVPVGKSGKNVAITEFSVRRYPLDKSRYEVMLEVTNTNDEPADVELTLIGDGQVVDVTRLSLQPNERLPRFYKDLAGASRTLEASIKLANGQPDELPADDHAYALMPERRRSRVLVVTPGNTYLEAALLLDEYLDVTTVPPAKYPPSGSFDVTIFDGVAPPLAQNTGSSLYLNPPEEGAPIKLGKVISDFGFDVWDKKHPILRWMSMGDIQVAAGHAFKPEKEDRVVGASALGPILVTGRRAGRKFVALGFDPRNSDFVLRVAWPLFLLNTINDFVEEDTSYVSSYLTGEVWRIPAPSGAEVATLKSPDGKTHSVPIKEGRAVYLGDEAGFYELVVKTEPEPTTTLFAANLSNPDESHIEPVDKLELGDKTALAPSGFDPGMRREIWLYLLIAALVLSTLEWITYHRRITV
jgi:von Willebrand factor type A domain/Aerotolerance regulator N-terminal